MSHDSANSQTPLHIAISRVASLDTIKALVESTPDKIRVALLVSFDSNGCTPLMLAVKMCHTTNNDDVVKYLVNEDCSGSSLLVCSTRKKKGQVGNVPLKYVASRESIFVGGGLESPQDLLWFMIVRTYRAKMKNIMSTTYGSGTLGNTNRPKTEMEHDVCLLQAAIICHDLIGSVKTASSILSYIIRNELFDRERFSTNGDFAGNLTIHVACLSDALKFDQILRLGQRETDFGINSEDCTLMEYLVKQSATETTTSLLIQNFAGDIPLHCAIRKGQNLEFIQLLINFCPSSVQTSTANGELPLHLAINYGSVDVIMALWKTYPEATLILDKSVGLYPFQLAASDGRVTQTERNNASQGKVMRSKAKKNAPVDGGDECTWDQMSLSFFLLRECPSIIDFF